MSRRLAFPTGFFTMNTRRWVRALCVRLVSPLVVVAFVARALWAVGQGVRSQGVQGREFLVLTARLLFKSLPVVVVVNWFCGAMLTVQAASSLRAFGAADVSGVVVGFGGVREVFPLLAGGALAARAGAEIASHLRAMRFTGQVEALAMMGLDPIAWLVAPRLLACIVGAPLCVLAAMMSGLWGAHVIGAFQLGIDEGTMWSSLLSGISSGDVAVGALRGLATGVIVGGIATYQGFVVDDGQNTSAGNAASVGRAAQRAVVQGMVAVCASCVLLSWLIYGGQR
jgi:phospholipid/cholesterol/gamma-HCH transport system permease protein